MKYYATKISDSMHETPEGFLLCVGVPIARTGEMEYGEGETPLDPGKDGVVYISRDEAEVFRAETIASFEGKPFTIKHPEDFVDPKNWKDLAKGHMMNVRRGEGENKNDLVADLLITDSFAISLVKNGLRGLSCGYEAEYVQTGEGKGKQTNIIGNHLALVEEGRAGTAYEINDEKGAFSMSKKLADKIKAMFTKVVDEAIKDEPAEKEEKKSEDEESKPGAGTPAFMDEMVKVCNAMKDALAAMKPKDEEKKEEKKEAPKDEEKEKGKDADPLEERLKALEIAVKKLMEMEASEESDNYDEDKSEDAEEEEKAEDGEAEAKLTGDTASRAEILSPGIKVTKDIKAKALKAAYETTDGKKIIDSLTGGKVPAYDSVEKVDTLFIAASELLKAKRGGDLSKTKTFDFSSAIFDENHKMSAEKMNEINAKRYNLK